MRFALLLYIAIPFFTHTDWNKVFKTTWIPTIKFNKDFIEILVAISGTTISPYLFFWQVSMEADVIVGMFLSVLVMYFIILTAGTVLFSNGITQIDTVEQAAKALEPIAGKASYLLFAIGVIETGLLAIPVLSGSLSYIVSETFGWKGNLDKKFYQAKPFYIVIIISPVVGLLINEIGISPVNALLYTAILYGLTSPILIGIVLIAMSGIMILTLV